MTAELDTLTFEEAFAELQGAVEELRGDALTLDRSLALYERGVALAQRCSALLTDAELRITHSPATRSAQSDASDRETGW
jgi:exodeoxyribonuclease VII small subunit